VLGQHREQVELALGEVDVDAVDAGATAGDVDLQRTYLDGLRGERRRRTAPPEQGLDPCHQLLQHERLDQVIVRSGFESGDSVVD
jgi:hypothetical protein